MERTTKMLDFGIRTVTARKSIDHHHYHSKQHYSADCAFLIVICVRLFFFFVLLLRVGVVPVPKQKKLTEKK